MSEIPERNVNILCVASFFKGADFLRECKTQGARVFLLTRERTVKEEWPRDALDDIIVLPDDATVDLFIYAGSEIARRIRLDRIVALEEFDVTSTALLREHLQIPGMYATAARTFRDKLMMRFKAAETGIRVPDFVHVLNYDALRDFMERVPAPWVLKPRSDVSAIGIRKLNEPEQVWRTIDALDARAALGERAPYHLLERFVAGEVFHVDSIVEGGEVSFANVSRYGRPPMDVAQKGGVFISRTLEYDSEDYCHLVELNQKLLKGFGLEHGATHAEFIKGATDGEFYFLEVASRVGGAYTAETAEAATGINLWREWARVELAGGSRAAVERPRALRDFSGIALSLARQEWPDTSVYDDPEIVYRVRKPFHVGLIVRSTELRRVDELLNGYAARFTEDFCAVAPPPERPPV